MSRHIYRYKTINGIKKKEHRHVMETHLGRELSSEEHVYHINGICNDNRIENLIVIRKNVEK